MAGSNTESSVVVALAEVRRLERDRQRRETAQHQAAVEVARQEEERAWQEARTRSSQNLPAVGVSLRNTTELPALEGYGRPSAGWPTVGQAPPGWDIPQQSYGAIVPELKPRSSAGAVILTFLLCGAGAAAGYWKLEEIQQGKLRERALVVATLETERSDAREGRSRAEQEGKLRIAALETQVKELQASLSRTQVAAAAIATVAVPAAAPVAAKPVAARPAPRPAAKKIAARKPAPARAAKSDAEPSAPIIPTRVITTKPVADDPLGGLRL